MLKNTSMNIDTYFIFATVRTLTFRSINITLSFFQNFQEQICGYNYLIDAMTFTTKDVPRAEHCFSIAELFGGNSTRGFVNQTYTLKSSWEDRKHRPDEGIHWEIRDSASYDPQGNYSGILYHQNLGVEDNDRGPYAWRTVKFYESSDCTDADTSPANESDNWYGNNCKSKDEGDCHETYYSVGSFSLLAAPLNDQEAQSKTCWDFAENGSAAGLHQSWKAVTGALVGVSVAVWLVL